MSVTATTAVTAPAPASASASASETTTSPEKATMTAFRRSAKILLTAALALAAGAAPLMIPTNAAADTAVVVDGFDRTVASGWGTASTGGAWDNLTKYSTTSVGNSEAKVSKLAPGLSFRAYQSTVSAEDAEVRADFTLPSIKDFQYTIESRKQADGSSYQSRIRVDGAGKLYLEIMRNDAGKVVFLRGPVIDVPVVVGQKLTMKLSTVGEAPVVVKAKVYVAGGTEPAWQVTTLDSAATAVTKPGYTGLMTYNGPASTTVDVATQNFTVTDVTPAPVDPGSGSDTDTGATLNVKHGADPVGSATYPVPSNALFVSPSGSDTGNGSLTSPYKTLTKALSKNTNGQTIVLRGGTYHEQVIVPPNHAATIQPYPNEAVWFDGTKPVSGFTAVGGAFAAPYDLKLDSSPTYTQGAPDGTAAGWQFVNPDYPMAAHPDMIWVNNVEQKEVASLAKLVAGSFYVDTASSKLYLGSDPGTKTVVASDLQWAFSLRAPGTVLRGFGIRRFADSVWQQGAVTSYYENQTLDNMTILDSATGGVGIYKPNSTIKNTTVDGSGQIGIQASKADNLVLDNVSVTDSNDEHFNPGPSAGGIKVTTTRTVTFKNSEILRTTGNSFWADESAYNITVANNEIMDGSRYGIFIEISSTATIVNNIVANNAYDGVMIADSDKVNIWNNTIVNNRRAVAMAQDSRRIQQLNVAGHDPRRSQPDLTMPWVIGGSTVVNNIMAAGPDATAVLAVESYELAFDASNLNIASNGNVYSQPALGVPNSAAVWARKSAQPYAFVLLDDFRGTTGQESTSINPLMTSPVDGAYAPKSTIAAKASTVALGLTADLATKTGQPTGAKNLGAWSRTSVG
ncbi:right-handed parallel beta-helix repeat-containing protein [uncultured Friedmanniella sp.]|uniref:right-handed parallel beta-helix repeat-containing protein n=1 Tax=uncultured Friedmanniella sp. TaxID=335381 RepID=UPI0035CB261A